MPPLAAGKAKVSDVVPAAAYCDAGFGPATSGARQRVARARYDAQPHDLLLDLVQMNSEPALITKVTFTFGVPAAAWM